jgi:hypothetical protein
MTKAEEDRAIRALAELLVDLLSVREPARAAK